MGLKDGYWVVTSGWRSARTVAFHDPEQGIRMNAGKADGLGRYWSGTMAYDLRPGAGALGRLTPKARSRSTSRGSVRPTASVGARTAARSTSSTRASGSSTRSTWTWTRGPCRPADDHPGTQGRATDGMTVDAEGSIWLSLWDGWWVRRYAPDGTLQRTIRLPVDEVTGCTFGGPDMDILYITTASFKLSEEAGRPAARRSMFSIRPGVTGCPRAATRVERPGVGRRPFMPSSVGPRPDAPWSRDRRGRGRPRSRG